MIPITCVLSVLANLAGVTIAVRNATIGVVIVASYMAKLSLQREKKCERKASSSSFSGFSFSMPVPLCQLPLSAGTSVVTTAPSS